MTEPIKKGDLFHVVAASSPITQKEDLLSGIKVFQEWGLICNHIDRIDRSWGYLAGDDEVRFNELHPNIITLFWLLLEVVGDQQDC